jgi:hypothetical protein
VFSEFSNPEPQGKGANGYVYPSLPAYIEMTSGDLSTFTPGNCGGTLTAGVDSCFRDPLGYVAPSMNPQDNVFAQLRRSGVPNPWGAYAEGMPAPCRLRTYTVASTGGQYVPRHFPVVYYANLAQECSQRALPYVAGSAPAPTALPQLSFIAPDTCSDMHDDSGCVVPTTPTDCSSKTGGSLNVCIGDDWLANNVPALAAHALVMVTWDEDAMERGNDNAIPLFFTGVGAAPVTDPTPYTLDGLLHGLQDYWGLPCFPGDGVSLLEHTPGSCGATSVPVPDVSIGAYSPQSGAEGSTITITGRNLGTTSAVSIGGVSTSFTVDRSRPSTPPGRRAARSPSRPRRPARPRRPRRSPSS